MDLPDRGKTARREVREQGPFRKVCEVHVRVCCENWYWISHERGSQGPNISGFRIYSGGNADTLYFTQGRTN